jgi:hypothetical protein
VDIWRYGVTEMVNNVIDHSGSHRFKLCMDRTAVDTRCWIFDYGVGIFNKIQAAFGLPDPRDALLELAKGKLTTDPRNHSGEGIFFASKMFEKYGILSRGVHFMHDVSVESDYLFSDRDASTAYGTCVYMRLANSSDITTGTIFDKFSSPDEYTFDKTIVPVQLALYEGEKLVSRSQARRLTARFEKFRRVVLDFEGVAEIGQAFADEVFRVFSAAHPSVIMTSINTTADVHRMISRAESADGSARPYFGPE